MITRDIFIQNTRHKALYSIMPLINIPSVLKHGIVSHDFARKLQHESVAEESVQEKREIKIINANRRLHSYVNLYFDAHNPMLSRLRDRNEKICILAIHPEILNLPGVVVADRNAAVSVARFIEPEKMWETLDFERIYAKYWNTQEAEINPFIRAENKAIKCAEVLVPDVVPTEYILGAVVINTEVKKALMDFGFTKQIIVDSSRFFERREEV